MAGLFEAMGAVLGLLLGSFLNVCVVRLPAGESVVDGRSKCRECGATIRWYDNLPVVSWLLLRGQCRSCGKTISWRYPAVELAVAAWFAVVAHRLAPLFRVAGVPLTVEAVAQGVLSAAGMAVLGWLLIGLAVTDWRTQILPNAMTLGGVAAGIFLVCLQGIFLRQDENRVLLHRANPLSSPGNVVDRGNVLLTGPEALIGGRMLAVIAAAAVLLAVRALYRAVRRREGLGLGDVKLLAMVAAFLGFAPAVLTLFVGVVAGSGYGTVLLLRRQAGGQTRLPLGSFLAGGGLLAALFGQQILGWYRSLL